MGSGVLSAVDSVGRGVFCAVRAEVLQPGQFRSLVVRESPAMNTEVEGSTALEAVSRQRLVKTD
jgi:hypothetical protein